MVCHTSCCVLACSVVLLLYGNPATADNDGNGYNSKCYDALGKPQRCVPEFINAAFNVIPEVTNTCGENGPIEYCIQTSAVGLRRACEICDIRDPYRSHPPAYLTDFNNNENVTWWQSETTFEGVQWPNQVNITLKLGKSFDITYVRLKFRSPRPESFAIYRRKSKGTEWLPYQYYSADCRNFYGLLDQNYISGGEETRPLCTGEFSDISPLTGGNVAFSTLEGRPSAYSSFDSSKELQDWVSATDIRVTLDRLNTFGDEVFGDPKVLRSYFYAISDLAVGGRCKCNGHASQCIDSSTERGERRLVCRCEHNTAGPDCEECLPFYNDKPWRRASQSNANACEACTCNGFSDKCFFDKDLYAATGHGGHCMDCSGNRDGPNCERCKRNYYQRLDGYCIPCHCDELGSRSLQCNIEGKCQCKPGVTGEKCERCDSNFYDFSAQGCKPCNCDPAGSNNNVPNCDDSSGLCDCKQNVEGSQCDNCKPGFFNLDLSNDFGCTPCFCFGHASVCKPASGYGQVLIESLFTRGNERWRAEDLFGRSIPMQYNSVIQNIGVSSSGRESIYFLAPDRFLGDQRGSYNQYLNFSLRIGEHSPKPSADDVILEGAGLRISRPIFGQSNTLPSIKAQDFSYRLHEHPDFGWNPRLSAREFMSILANLTSIKIRGTYTTEGVGFLDNVKLKTARRGAAGSPAPWVEMCTCPEGYIGQFCESCAPGYTHEPRNGGPFARCVPCSCHNHADICDPESGQCICQHNTGGDNCERCARGFYGNALQGTEDDCKACPCPNQGACIQLQDETIVCLECPDGYAGPQCEFCADGYYGDPTGKFGEPTECKPCDCNGNIDPNAVGNCDRTTGECLKCIYNSGGPRCDQCLPGFFGDALALPKGDCKPCECNALGTIPTAEEKFVCEQPSGQCPCKDNVIGRQCDRCEDGFFDLSSGAGCQECMCDSIGSLNSTCNMRSGQCFCRVGIVGLRCNDCAPNHYGFSDDGCEPCDCDPIGSLSLQCDPMGQCPCRENVEGRACDTCKENKYNRQAGCVDCPSCYNLVQEAVDSQRDQLEKMEKLLEEIANTPTVIDDLDFERKLQQVQERVNALWTDASAVVEGDDKSLLDKVNELKEKVNEVESASKKIRHSLNRGMETADECSRNLSIAEDRLESAQESLKNAQRFLNTEGAEALQKAKERSQQYDEQTNMMSEMAAEARQLADEHERQAEMIEKIGAAAVNTSQSAYDTARNAYDQQINASDHARTIQQSIDRLKDEMKNAEVKSERALEIAKEAYNNAVNLYKDAYSVSLPSVDLEGIKRQSMAAKEDAETLEESLESLKSERQELIDEANEEAMQAEELLADAYRHQQMADELLADLDQAKASAEEARTQSENTFQEAQKIYDTLQDFNRNVEESKSKSIEAQNLIPEIERLIFEAEDKTRLNVESLEGAKDTASRALESAQEAETIAKKASEEADAIRAESGETKDQAGELRDEALSLSTRVVDTMAGLTEAEGRVAEEDKEVKVALEKASDASSLSKEAYDKIKLALDTVRDIELALNNLDHINDEGLESLRRKIEEVEAEIQAADVDSKIDSLRQARNKQTLWLKNYEDELEGLRMEVENVEEIRNSLPDDTKCWKRIRLEP